MREALVSPLTPTDARVWTLYVDGREIPANLIEIRSERYGYVEFGMREGAPGQRFHGFLYHEPGGGGAVTLPWCLVPGSGIYVGLVYEERPNLGGRTLCIMGGQMELGESRHTAQRDASRREGGVNTDAAHPLPGLPFVVDRLLWAANPHEGEGVHAFHLSVPLEALEETADGNYRFNADYCDGDARCAALVFLPWHKAVSKTADTVALAATARLISYLNSSPSL